MSVNIEVIRKDLADLQEMLRGVSYNPNAQGNQHPAFLIGYAKGTIERVLDELGGGDKPVVETGGEHGGSSIGDTPVAVAQS